MVRANAVNRYNLISCRLQPMGSCIILLLLAEECCMLPAACAVYHDAYLFPQLMLLLLLYADYKPSQMQPKRVKKMIRRNEALQKVTSETLAKQLWQKSVSAVHHTLLSPHHWQRCYALLAAGGKHGCRYCQN
jgi:hypothetical protein